MMKSRRNGAGQARRTAGLLGGLLLAGMILSAASAQREWVPEPAALPACEGHCDLEMGCQPGDCIGYASSADWASEVQVRFLLPSPPLGGPWLLEYVAFFVAGSAPHRVIVREASAPGEPPGAIIDERWEFAPAYASWPPSGWTYVELRPELPFPDYLQAVGGESLTIGLRLLPGDALGLVSPGEFDEAWSLHEGRWYEQGPLGPAIRLGLGDLGLSDNQEATWGRVKGLFK